MNMSFARRSFSADDLPELRETMADLDGQPRLLLYNDGTGCVLELRRPGDGPTQCGECDYRRPQTELPKTVAMVAHKVADFITAVAEPCSRYSMQMLLGSCFGGAFLCARWLLSTQMAFGSGYIFSVTGGPTKLAF